MTIPKIKTLDVKSFRGIRDSELDFDGKSLILFGENGHGKSSFVDALEFFFKGNITHLQGAEGVSVDKHGPHILGDQKDTSVSLQFTSVADSLKRTFDDVPAIPPALSSTFELGTDATFILRRKNLLDFIMAQAGPRYTQLAALIGIEDLDKVELALMHKRDNLQSQFQSAQKEEGESRQGLLDLLGQRTESDGEILAALNLQLAQAGQSLLSALSEIESRKVAIVSGTKSPEKTQRATDLAQASLALRRMQSGIHFLEKHQDLWIKLSDLKADLASARELAFERLLSVAQDLLRSNEGDTCPLCQQPIGREQLVKQIDSRLATLTAVSKRVSTIRTLANSLSNEISQFVGNLESTERQLLQVDAPWNSQTSECIKSSLSNLRTALSVEPFKMTLGKSDEYMPEASITVLESMCAGASGHMISEQGKLAESEADKQAVKLVDLLTEAKRLRDKLFLDRTNRQNAERILRAANHVYEIFTDTKKNQVQSVYDNLQTDVRAFYEKIHPSEGTGEITLTIPKTRRASAHLKMKFHDHEPEDPRAFNSEAHLDSLGLCIFLAFVRRFNGGFPIIVLDDVVSSIDAAHRARVCDLLTEEFGEYQVFVTTHDWLWFEEWHAHQQASKVEHLFKNVRIIDWSLTDGVKLDQYKPRWDRITDKLAQGDKSGAASEGRRALEWLLLELCVDTGTPLIAKYEPRYVVNELYPPLKKRVLKISKKFTADNQAVIQALDANIIFGNLLTHNNPQAEGASIGEVQSLIQAVHDFHDAFYCSDCRSFVKYYDGANVLKCKCANKMWAS